MSKKKPNQSIAQVERLKQLRRQILDGYDATEKLIRSSKDRARDALKEAVMVGKALIEAREIVGYGRFVRWLKTECESVKQPTAYRYMSLCNSLGQDLSHVRKVGTNNLRTAYLALGIIKEQSDTPQPPRIALPQTTSIDVGVIESTETPVQKIITKNKELESEVDALRSADTTVIIADNPPTFNHTCPNCGHQFNDIGDTHKRIAANN
jgi:hypothetical protein